MKRRRGTKHEAVHEPAEATSLVALDAVFMSYLRPAILAIATALLVSTPLIASESIISDGSGATWHVMWLALAVISLLGSALFTDNSNRWTWADLFVLLLVAWHVVSAAVCDGNQRHAWNAAWQWAAYGALAIVLRQQLTSAKETRALVVVLLALALAVSFHAFYQYAYSQPMLRAAYEKNPEEILRQMGVTAEPGSPLRTLAENRINSKEPTAEFALTNSLAGFLLPWFLLAIALAFSSVQKELDWKLLATLLVVTLVMFGVLLLTKSRTAVLAGAGGCVLILLYGRRSGWQLDWRWPAGLAAGAMVIGLIVVAAKGLDAEVLSESPKSVLYRLEYWRATASLIADEPLFGVGPGNFQERYVNYKLPQASETVADPHNFLLEIWSTAGTPALLALLGLMFATAWQLSRRTPVVEPVEPLPAKSSAENGMEIGHFAIYAGVVVGLLLAGILGFIVFDALETTHTGVVPNSDSGIGGIPIIWLTSAVSLLICSLGLKDWVNRGELPRWAIIIALIALLVNLLAAGAAIFAGVVNAAWLLWAIAMQQGSLATNSTPAKGESPTWSWSNPQVTKVISIGMACAFVAALVGCYMTEYQPVLQGHVLQLEAISARDRGETNLASSLIDQAIQTDPWAPMPRRLLADFRLRQWLGKQIQRNWGPFTDAMADYERSSPHHYTLHEERGQWLLLAARKTKNAEKLQMSAEAFETASKCYPNSAFLHAQLAAVYAEQDRTADARSEADEAKRLDDLCPHKEQKLEKRHVFDPAPGRYTKVEDGKLKPLTAAEVVAQLRDEAAKLNNQKSTKPAERTP